MTIPKEPAMRVEVKVAEQSSDWARNRAIELIDAQTGTGWAMKHAPNGAVNAFARYIAEHEEPPVDPLLIEARKLVAQRYHAGNYFAEGVLRGESDDNCEVKWTLAALRRGIELAGQTP